jgi:hypothetical protein
MKLCTSRPSLTMSLSLCLPDHRAVLQNVIVLFIDLLLIYYITVMPCQSPSITGINRCGAFYCTKQLIQVMMLKSL